MTYDFTRVAYTSTQLHVVDQHSEWIDGSKQSEAFLIEGQPKYFTCLSFGNIISA